ncbi:MAG: hypothetical protein ACXACP_01890 [Candidatus Hodarchaeales archaeon]
MISKQEGETYCLSCGERIKEETPYPNYCDKVCYDVSQLPKETETKIKKDTREEKAQIRLWHLEIGIGIFLLVEAGWILVDPSLSAFRLFLYAILGLTVSVVITSIITIIFFMFFTTRTTSGKPLIRGGLKFYLTLWIGVSMVVTVVILSNQPFITSFIVDTTGFNPEAFIRELQAITLHIVAILVPIGLFLVYNGYQERKALLFVQKKLKIDSP